MIHKIDPQILRYDRRFDIGFKLIYLSLKASEADAVTAVYLRHISALTGGTFAEPGNLRKIGKTKFVNEFNNISEKILTHGFDPDVSVIPISAGNTAINGAHRIASLLHTKNQGYFQYVQSDEPNYDSTFFENAGLDIQDLDWSACALANYLKNSRIFIIWPSAYSMRDKIIKNFKEVTYQREIRTTDQGLFNIVRNVYLHEGWVKDTNGIFEKTRKCSSNEMEEKLVVLLVRGHTDVEFCNIKNSARHYLQLGKHSIHSSDDHEESIRLSQLLFNQNFIDLIPHIPNQPHNTYTTFISIFREKVKRAGSFNNPFAITGSSLLGLLNMRKINDLDYLALDANSFNVKDVGSSHDNQLKYYPNVKSNLIADPHNYFYFDGMKFLSLQTIINFKLIRGEEKDLLDLKVLSRLSNQSYSLRKYLAIKSMIRRFRWNVRLVIIKILKLIGVFATAKKAYDFFK